MKTKWTSIGVALWRFVRPFRLWLNAATSDDGCTMVDARKLREYNHGLAVENERLRDALRRISARANEGVSARNLGDMAASHLRDEQHWPNIAGLPRAGNAAKTTPST